MRLLFLITISAVVFGGCSTGAGMQATPPAPISQTAGSEEPISSAEQPLSKATTGETASEDAANTDADADVQAPVSQSHEEESIPTGAGGRFLVD